MLQLVESSETRRARQPWRLIIVSKVELFRTAVSTALKARLSGTEILVADDLRVVDEVATSNDVILIDSSSIRSEHYTGAGAARRLAVLGLNPSDRRTIVGWLAAGAIAFVPESATEDEVAQFVSSASRDEIRCPAAISEIIIRDAARTAHDAQTARLPKPTQREYQIALLIDRGLTNQAIAIELSITLSTVKNHVHSMIKRHGVRDRVEAAKAVKAARSRACMVDSEAERSRSALDPIIY